MSHVKRYGKSKKQKSLKRKRSKPSGLARDVKRLKKGLKRVAVLADQGTGHKTYRERFTTQVGSSGFSNTADYTSIGLLTKFGIERSLTTMSFFDPSNPAVFIIADGNSGSFQRQYEMTPSFKISMRNNYLVGVRLKWYLLLPKMQTTVDPVNAIDTGLSDKGISPVSNVLCFPTDSDIFNELWRIDRSGSRIVEGGQCIKLSYSTPTFLWDPAYDDVFNKTYYPQASGANLLVRLEGLVGHDPVIPLNLGSLPNGLDIQTTTTVQISYDAGMNISYIETSDNSEDPSVDGVVSVKPQARNQDFNSGSGI